MSEFSDDWLALRAPADTAARVDALVPRLAAQPPGADGTLQVLDLGCGTGANLRHLAPLLAAAGHMRQRWICVDHDPTLLARLPERTAAWAQAAGLRRCAAAAEGLTLAGSGWSAQVAARRLDLHGALAALPLPTGGLVTASALLDLVSARWLDALLERCWAARCALLFVLSYDGRCSLSPRHVDDAGVIDRVNRHQRTDKGFGPALGPSAADVTAARCRALGWRVETAPSDWTLGAEDTALQRALLAGWRQAAVELVASGHGDTADAQMDDWRDDRLGDWLATRLGWVDDGTSRLQVGHLDLVALP